jgi:tetratricopeptide (TPR) repeat protein
MAQGEVFDIVLFGFRNDLAQARSLAFLEAMPTDKCGPWLADTNTPPPRRLFVGLDPGRAEELSAKLDHLGAQVTLVPAGTAFALPARPAGRAGRRLSIGLQAAALVLLAAGGYRWLARTPLSSPLPPVRPSGERLQLIEVQPAQDVSRAVALNAEGIAQAEAGQFAAAVEALRAALRLAPDQAVLARNLQTVLYNWGVREMAAKEFADAALHLDEAAQIGPRAEVLTALGIVYLRQADDARADDALQRALALVPNDQNTLLAMVQVALDQDQRARALDLLQRAREAGARGTQLDALQQRLSREVDVEWDFVHLDSPHFRANFADGDDGTVRQVLAGLEDAYDEVGRKFDYTPSERTDVVLYTQRDFHNVTQSPHWAGAAFDGRIKIPVRGLDVADPRLDGMLRHEYAHSLVARLAGAACPAWLNEGLAVWAEESEDAERISWAEDRIAGQPLLPLDTLSGSFVGLPQDRVEVAYAESYLAVRVLLDRYGPGSIPTLLQVLGRTNSLQEAFSTVYRADLQGFEQDLLRQWAR